VHVRPNWKERSGTPGDWRGQPAGEKWMPRWRVDFIGKLSQTPGSVEAKDEKSAIAEAANEFHIPPARQNKIVVTRIHCDD
jgi:hypothetical protein